MPVRPVLAIALLISMVGCAAQPAVTPSDAPSPEVSILIPGAPGKALTVVEDDELRCITPHINGPTAFTIDSGRIYVEGCGPSLEVYNLKGSKLQSISLPSIDYLTDLWVDKDQLWILSEEFVYQLKIHKNKASLVRKITLKVPPATNTADPDSYSPSPSSLDYTDRQLAVILDDGRRISAPNDGKSVVIDTEPIQQAYQDFSVTNAAGEVIRRIRMANVPEKLFETHRDDKGVYYFGQETYDRQDETIYQSWVLHYPTSGSPASYTLVPDTDSDRIRIYQQHIYQLDTTEHIRIVRLTPDDLSKPIQTRS